MRQHCTDGSVRFCRWRAHTEALSEDSGPEALSTQGQYFALQVFYKILKPVAGELSANCCRTITMTRYTIDEFAYESSAPSAAWAASYAEYKTKENYNMSYCFVVCYAKALSLFVPP